MTAAAALIFSTCAKAVAPRKPLTVSQWADDKRYLSSKESQEHGKWYTSRNPPLREPMDCMSTRSPVRDVVLMFPIQYGKTAIAQNVLGYIMDHAPGPVMVCLPAEVSMTKWVQQKLQPMIDETPELKRALTSVASRDSSNTRTFKDFQGGQLYVEHAGTPSRLKSTSVKRRREGSGSAAMKRWISTAGPQPMLSTEASVPEPASADSLCSRMSMRLR